MKYSEKIVIPIGKMILMISIKKFIIKIIKSKKQMVFHCYV